MNVTLQPKNRVMAMTKNVGPTDRFIRIVTGLVVLLIGLLFGSWWGLLGLIPLVTGMVRWCPLYAPFHFSTVRRASAT